MVYKTVTVDVDVDVDLDDFDTDDLVYELESRGFKGVVGDEKEELPSTDYLSDSIYKLYKDYITVSPEIFNKELKRFFRDVLNVNEY